MESEFATAYGRLNAEQKAAVDCIEGPVLVVAGPGTGKTQILSLRVANILQQTDTDAGAILCLTFTNFAATNMRERLLQLIGSDARRIRTQTFHSFAADLMALYPDYFWNGARLSVAPDSVQLDLIQAILATLPLDHPLASRFSGQYTALSDVQQALRLSKEAGLTPGKLSAMIDYNLAYIENIEPTLIELLSPALSHRRLAELQVAIEALPDETIDVDIMPLQPLSSLIKDSLRAAIAADEPTGKTTHTGAWKRRWLQTVDKEKGLFDERRRNAWWRAFSDVYQTYREQLHGRGYYDYSDMIVEVISQLEQQPELRASIQEKFLYILIDEFQDTNAAQLRLSHLVAGNEATGDTPNLMAVGDDDQSIFGFNGAELSNMLAFRQAYPATKLIVLTQNYRSHQSLLDTAGKIIAQAEDRVVNHEPDLDKHLRAASDVTSGELTHRQYPTRAHQFSAVAQRIERLYRSHEAGSIAVLARQHSSLKELSTLLNKLHVPIRYEQQNNILHEEAVEQLCLIARVVAAIGDGERPAVNAFLAQLLQHPMWQVPPSMLWQLAVSNYIEPDWLNSLLVSTDEHLIALGNWLTWLAGEAARKPLPLIIEYLLGTRASEHMTSPLREYYLQLRTVDDTYLRALSGVNVLLELVQEFAQADARLSDFVRFIELNEELDRSVVDQSWFTSGQDAVQLMTVHKAKGLEFDTVFLVDAVEDNWQPRRLGRKPPANLPLQPYGEQYDDYVRLLYVAATRAKRSLLISSYAVDTQGREVLATPLLNAALRAEPVPADELDEPIHVLEAAITWPRLEHGNEKDLLSSRLENYALSATGLCQFLDITSGGPQYFMARSLLRVPEAVSAHQAYGNAMHAAMQTAQWLTSRGHFSLQAVQTAYETALERQAIPLHDKQRYSAHGKAVLANLFSQMDFSLPKTGRAEVTIGPLRVGNARVWGTLDHLVVTDGKLLITDYKTGAPIPSFDTRDQSKQIKVWRHRLQLTFYAWLAAQERSYQSITTRIAYLEAESANQLLLSTIPSEEELARLTQLVQVVWRHITELDFPDTRSYSQDSQGIEHFIHDLLTGSIKKAA